MKYLLSSLSNRTALLLLLLIISEVMLVTEYGVLPFSSINNWSPSIKSLRRLAKAIQSPVFEPDISSRTRSTFPSNSLLKLPVITFSLVDLCVLGRPITLCRINVVIVDLPVPWPEWRNNAVFIFLPFIMLDSQPNMYSVWSFLSEHNTICICLRIVATHDLTLLS